MKKNLRILFFAKSIEGGTGTFVDQFLARKKLEKQDLELRILSLEKPALRVIQGQTPSFFYEKEFLPVRYSLLPRTLQKLLKEYLWLRYEVKKFNPDVILSIDNHCNLVVALYKVISSPKIRIILTVHNNISAVAKAKTYKLERFLLKSIGHYLLEHANKIVAVSEGVAKDTQAFFNLAHMPLVIHVSTNVEKIKILAQKPLEAIDKQPFQSSKLKIISIGRFAPQKDFETLIQAFCEFKRNYRNSALYLIGDGPDSKKLKNLVKANKLTSSVHFLGWKQNVYPYLKKADVFVLSTHYEGFPYVLLEAAALGKPIVATDVDFGPREFLADGEYGLLVPENNAEELAKKMMEISKKRKIYAQKSKERIAAFSEKRMFLKYYQLLKKTIS